MGSERAVGWSPELPHDELVPIDFYEPLVKEELMRGVKLGHDGKAGIGTCNIRGFIGVSKYIISTCNRPDELYIQNRAAIQMGPLFDAPVNVLQDQHRRMAAIVRCKYVLYAPDYTHEEAHVAMAMRIGFAKMPQFPRLGYGQREANVFFLYGPECYKFAAPFQAWSVPRIPDDLRRVVLKFLIG